MGLLDGMKLAIGLAREAAASVPKWGRIVNIEPKLGRFARITLEIHYGREPPSEYSTLARVPRGMKVQIGQDVAIRRWVGEETGSVGYWIEWHRPPQYGSPREELPEEEHPVKLFMDAQRARREGRITEAEFERARQGFVAWGQERMPASRRDARDHRRTSK